MPSSATLRGRLDVVRQFSTLAASPDRLACRFDELSSDIPLNQIMKAAVAKLLRLSRAPQNQRNPEDREEPLTLRGARCNLPGESEPVRGHIPFELTLSALGESVTHSCRACYVTTLCDDEHPVTGQPTRVIGNLVMRYDLLNWADLDACDENTGEPVRLPTPRWREVDLFSLIPRAIEAKLDDLIEEQALALDRKPAGKSTA